MVMTKFKKIFLMFALLFSAALCHSNDIAKTKKDGTPITIIKTSSNEVYDRSSSISAHINGHTLIVAFKDNIGEVVVDITTANGGTVYYTAMDTPSGYQFYIPLEGAYVVTFTLTDGDEYYGEFVIED